MLKWFYCPDEEKIEVQECLKKCRLGRRCLTRPTLTMISEDRPWTGQPSTTQLLNGTEYSFLKLTKDYAIKPKSRAFMLLGTQHHQRLEEVAKVMGIMSEQKLTGEITGILDLLEFEYECDECEE